MKRQSKIIKSYNNNNEMEPKGSNQNIAKQEREILTQVTFRVLLGADAPDDPINNFQI